MSPLEHGRGGCRVAYTLPMELTVLRTLAGLGTGLAGGLLSGLFGVGGGLVLIPLLGLSLGVGQHAAQGLSLAVMLLPNSLPAVIQYRRRGVPLRLPLLAFLMAGFLAGVFAGARLALLVPPRPLRFAFSAFLVLMALRQLRGPRGGTSPEGAAPNLGLERLAFAGLATGLAGGLSSGLLGIGGALVIVPLLVGLLHVGQHEAQLASLALLLPPLGLPAVWVYLGHHPLPWAFLACVVLGFQGGAYLGARVATRLEGKRLGRIFGLLLLVMGVLLAFRR